MERMPWRVGRATLDVVQLVAMPPDAVLQLDAVIISVAAPLCLQPQTFLDPQQAGGVPHFSFSPQGAQLVSRNPGVVNETLFGHPSSFTRKVPVGVVCRLWLPPWRHRTHLFVCTRCFRLFVFVFSSLVAENLALRLADACIHQCSTRVRLCHLGADLFVGGFPFIAYMDSLDRHT